MNIIELPREAGLRAGNIILSSGEVLPFVAPVSATDCLPELQRLVALVRAAVLEEAAEACENTLAQHYMKQVIPDRDEALLLAACADCAAAIRALKGNNNE